jgi:hypothetical protein
MGLERSRSCSWIVQIADVGAAFLAAMRKRAERARRRWKALWFGEIVVL